MLYTQYATPISCIDIMICVIFMSGSEAGIDLHRRLFERKRRKIQDEHALYEVRHVIICIDIKIDIFN